MSDKDDKTGAVQRIEPQSLERPHERSWLDSPGWVNRLRAGRLKAAKEVVTAQKELGAEMRRLSSVKSELRDLDGILETEQANRDRERIEALSARDLALTEHEVKRHELEMKLERLQKQREQVARATKKQHTRKKKSPVERMKEKLKLSKKDFAELKELREELDTMVAAGEMTEESADTLYQNAYDDLLNSLGGNE